MKKFKRLLTLLLCFALMAAYVPTSYAALVDDNAGTAKLEYVLLKSTGSGFAEMTAQDIAALTAYDGAHKTDGDGWSDATASNLFYVGIKAVNFDNIEHMTEAASTGRLRSLTWSFNYNSDYLVAEPRITAYDADEEDYMFSYAKFNNKVLERLTAMDSENTFATKADKYTYADSGVEKTASASDSSLTGKTGEWKTFYSSCVYVNDSGAAQFTGAADEYIAIYEFGVKAYPADGGQAIIPSSFYSGSASLDIGRNTKTSYSAGVTGNGNIENVLSYNGDGLKALFPKEMPTLGGTVTIDGTATYGQTLTANTTQVTGKDGDFTYKWTVAGSEEASSEEAIGSNATLTLDNPAWAGKVISCEVGASGSKGSVSGSSAAIGKKTLAVSGATVTAKTFDNTDTATVTGATVSGKVGKDVVTVNATGKFADKNAGTNKNVNVTYTLSGDAANAYQLDKTTETLQGDINKAQLTVVGNNASVKVGDTANLSAKVTGEVQGASAGVTYTYAVKDGSTDVITVSNGVVTGVKPGSKVVTATGTITDTTNYEFATGKNVGDLTVTVANRVPKGITVKTQPTKKEYEVGETLDLTGLVVTVTYDDKSTEEFAFDDFAANDITATPANGEEVTLAMNGKPIVISMTGCDPENTDNLTVTKAATRVTLKNTPSKYTKAYDGTTAVKVADWATAPEFASNNGTVDASDAVYTLAQAGVGDEINITVTGLKVDGQAAAFDGVVAKGEITIADATLTLGNLNQTVGTINPVIPTLNPADETATVEVKYEVITQAAKAEDTEAGTPAVEEKKDFYAWGPVTVEGKVTTVKAYLEGLPAGTKVNVKASSTGATNTKPADATDVLNINARPSGGGGSSAITVTFRAGTNGKITDGKASVSVNRNAKLTSANVPTVTANDGYKFLGWSLDGENVVDPTKDAVTKSITYTALYEATKGGHDAYMFGYADGTFQPNANITRAEAAALMARLNAEYDLTANYTGNLKDVVAGQWYTKVINFNVEKGLITGYTDGTFKPNNAITRQEFCTIVAKYLGLENTGSANFNDTKGVYAEGYIAQLVEKGIVSGYNDGSFKPNANITRAEATRILNGVFDRTPNKETVDTHIAEYTVNLKDVPATHWAYYEILEAAVNHTPADFHK